MRDPDFTSIEKMNNPNMGLRTARKDKWSKANEA